MLNREVESKIREYGASLEEKGNEIDTNKKRDYSVIRTKNPCSMRERFVYPSSFSLYNDKLPLVFKNGNNEFTTPLDISIYKNVGGKNVYVNTKIGSASNDGLTINTPCQHFGKALTLANNGDTVIITNSDGDLLYREDWLTNSTLAKSVNIIALNNIWIVKANKPTWTKKSGFTNIYETARNSVATVYDVTNVEIPFEYVEVLSVQEVENTPFSWFCDGTNTYVHSSIYSANEKIVPILKSNLPIVKYDNATPIKGYFENLNFIGGDSVFSIIPDTKIDHELYIKNSKCLRSTVSDVISISKIKRGYFQNVICAYGQEDGFNYSGAVDFIEINCIGFANGDGTRGTDNGSTAHTECRGIRINCTYYDNVGPNLMDVLGAKSVNLGCVTFNSKANNVEMRQGMGAQSQGNPTELWFEGCKSFGNKYDFKCYAETTININKCEYDTITKTDSTSIINADTRL